MGLSGLLWVCYIFRLKIGMFFTSSAQSSCIADTPSHLASQILLVGVKFLVTVNSSRHKCNATKCHWWLIFYLFDGCTILLLDLGIWEIEDCAEKAYRVEHHHTWKNKMVIHPLRRTTQSRVSIFKLLASSLNVSVTWNYFLINDMM